MIKKGIDGRFNKELVILMAAISTIIVPILAINRLANTKIEIRTPNFSLIRSANPFRVISVNLTPISWVIPRKMVTMTKRNKIG